MTTGAVVSLTEPLRRLPPSVRATVQAARRAVKAVAPAAREVMCQTEPPRSKSAIWKLVRYVSDEDDAYVAGLGIATEHVLLFFPRGHELDDPTELLEGRGKQFRFIRLRVPADADRPNVRKLLRNAFKLAKQRA